MRPTNQPSIDISSWPAEAVKESQMRPMDKERSSEIRGARGPLRQTNDLVHVPKKAPQLQGSTPAANLEDAAEG